MQNVCYYETRLFNIALPWQILYSEQISHVIMETVISLVQFYHELDKVAFWYLPVLAPPLDKIHPFVI